MLSLVFDYYSFEETIKLTVGFVSLLLDYLLVFVSPYVSDWSDQAVFKSPLFSCVLSEFYSLEQLV